jgi:hypothetical protein
MRVEKMSYGPFEGGLSGGIIGFIVQMGGPQHKEATPEEIITWMHKTKKGHGSKMIRFYLGSEIDEGEMLTLIKTIKDWGYIVQVVSPGTAWHPWMGEGTYVIVEINDPVWVGFGANELWYEPNPSETISDPVLPGGKIESTMYYIKGTLDRIWEYIIGSSIPWAYWRP